MKSSCPVLPVAVRLQQKPRTTSQQLQPEKSLFAQNIWPGSQGIHILELFRRHRGKTDEDHKHMAPGHRPARLSPSGVAPPAFPHCSALLCTALTSYHPLSPELEFSCLLSRPGRWLCAGRKPAWCRGDTLGYLETSHPFLPPGFARVIQTPLALQEYRGLVKVFTSKRNQPPCVSRPEMMGCAVASPSAGSVCRDMAASME